MRINRPYSYYESAAEILAAIPGASDGVYDLWINGRFIPIYCDMTNGGYMLLGRGYGTDHAVWGNATGFVGDWMNPSPTKNSTFKVSDEIINWLRVNKATAAYKVTTEGTYVNTRYWKMTDPYVHNNSGYGSNPVNWTSYSDEACTLNSFGGTTYWGSISDYQPTNRMYACCHHSSIGWVTGNTSGSYQFGNASGCNINIWIK
jgi:hypothetical protein